MSSVSSGRPGRHGSEVEPPGSTSSVGRADERTGRVRGSQRLERRRELEGGGDREELLLDRGLGRRVLALAELKPAERPAPIPQEERRPSLAPVVVPGPVLTVHGDGERNVEALQRRRQLRPLAREWEPRRVDAHHRQPVRRVALVPGAQIRERAHARRVGRVDEMHEEGPAGTDPLDGRGLLPDPLEGRRERRHGDVHGFGAHRAGILLASGRRVVETNQEEHMTLTIWDRIENARQRWDVLRHPFYQRWTAGELSPRGAGSLLGPVPPCR